MDETERERSRREKSAFYDDVLERLTAMGITDLKTRADIAEREWYMFTLNCEYYERERFKRHREREQQREIERECSQLMDEEETARQVETPNTDHDEKRESATDHDQQPEGEKQGDGGAKLETGATEGDGDEPDSETAESLDLLREIDGMLSDSTRIIRTAAKNAIPRLKTGIPSLDEKLGGGLTAGVHILMAPPSTGKTAQSLFICKKAISDKANDWGDEQVLYWGLDTSEPDVRARLASCVSLLKGKEPGLPRLPADPLEAPAHQQRAGEDQPGDKAQVARRAGVPLHGLAGAARGRGHVRAGRDMAGVQVLLGGEDERALR